MTDRAADFLALHVPGTPLLLPNPWDAGSARLLAGMGFHALATTSAGFAGTLGRIDGNVTRDEALAPRRRVVGADRRARVSADLENGFADDPDGVAETVRLAVDAGLAGCSVEDWDPAAHEPSTTPGSPPSGWPRPPRRRTAVTVASCSRPGPRTTSTARDPRTSTTRSRRLQAYQEAGADVLYAPGREQRRGHPRGSSSRSTGRSTCWPSPTHRR